MCKKTLHNHTLFMFTITLTNTSDMVHIEASHQPSAAIYVVEPVYLGFSIVSDSNWVLEVGKEYAVTVQLYDKNNHKILMAEVCINYKYIK